MRKSESVYRKVQSFMEEKKMLPENALIAAGISGGSDSVVMLDILRRYIADRQDLRLAVIHVNHGIRGEEALRDAEFVHSVCGQWEIPFFLYEYDVPSLARSRKLSVEEAGREVRREAFLDFRERRIKKGEIFRIALAHNENDLGETVIHNLARGTGLRGLCSMKPVSGERIRPVLCLTKEEILLYAAENGLLYMTDSSNLTDDYTRNKIRNHVLPYLTENINARALEHIAGMASLSEEAVSYMERKASETLDRCMALRPCSDGILLGEPYLEEDPALQPYVLLEAFDRLSGRRKDFTIRHVKDVMKLGCGGAGRRTMLPYGITAVKEREGIHLTPGKTSGPENSEPSIKSNIFPYEGQKIPQNHFTKWFDYDKIKGDIVFRTRRAGDFMVIHPDGRTKKLTRIMIDDGIPSAGRDMCPLAAAGSHVLWIAGGRRTEAFRIDKSTKRVLVLEYQEEDHI